MHTTAEVFKQLERDIKGVIRKLPRQLGVEVVAYSMTRFREQGWDGNPWPRRKGNTDPGRAVLIGKGSGRLRRSIRITKTTSDSVTVGSDLPYAKIHNEGFNGTENVREHTRTTTSHTLTTLYREDTGAKERVKVRQKSTGKVNAFVRRMRMPRRQFLGDSPYLRRNLNRRATAEFNRALRPYMKI